MTFRVSAGAVLGLILAESLIQTGCARASQAAPAVNSKTARLISHALDQTTWGTKYDGRYVRIPYPKGDVSRKRGVCTDVVIRAYRHIGIDLQQLIHEDARKNRRRYPGIPQLDSNIDHRRCPNQIAFFKAHGKELTNILDDSTSKQWQPGDIVFWKLDDGKDHVGILTLQKNSRGFPFAVHNIGSGPQHEDVLANWKIVGHFRYP